MKNGLYKDNFGNVFYYKNNKLHRENGPAVFHVKTGDYFYFYDNVLHRIDGPAVIYGHGKKEWYLNGKKYSTKDFKRIVKLLAFK